MARKQEPYGLSCCIRNCRASFDILTASRSTWQRSEFLHGHAGKAGWVIGLNYEGQAEYACPNHADQLIDPSPLTALRDPPRTFKATVVTQSGVST